MVEAQELAMPHAVPVLKKWASQSKYGAFREDVIPSGKGLAECCNGWPIKLCTQKQQVCLNVHTQSSQSSSKAKKVVKVTSR